MATKFDFLSPGVNIREIDRSILPAQAQEPGPILIGRAKRGPALKPVLINTYEDFVSVFGEPVLGTAGSTSDVWRQGNILGPQYAGIAAQAHLASQTSPVTFVRLLGEQDASQTSGVKAGWSVAGLNAAVASNSTAYGLFMVNSASANANPTGSLAAILYATAGAITLSGTIAGSSATTSSAGTLIKSSVDGRGFQIDIWSSGGSVAESHVVNFNRDDQSYYIRSKMNTNPVLTNSALYSSVKNYWLGETFERDLADNVTNSNAGEVYGIILPLQSGSAANWGNWQQKMRVAQSGWVIAQDTGPAASYVAEDAQKLFRLVSLHEGSDLQKNIMVGISNITAPNDVTVNAFATFDVVTMDMNGNALETMAGCDLNPQSDNYIVKRFGDTSFEWIPAERRYRVKGSEPNISNYFRVEVDGLVEAGGADGLVPFGFLGPVRPKGFSLISGSFEAQTFGATDSGSAENFAGAFVQGNADMPYAGGVSSDIFAYLPTNYSASFRFPSLALRDAGSEGSPVSEYEVYYGIRPKTAANESRNDAGFGDYLRGLPADIESYSASGDYEYSFVFSMDDLVVDSGTRTVTYTSGSRAAGTSFTATSGSSDLLGDDPNASSGVEIKQFVMPIWGGRDGLDVTEKEPFRNTLLDGGADINNAMVYSLNLAIDSIKDNEQVIANTLSVPGVTVKAITDKVISTCETRKDLLGIIDLEQAYVPTTEAASETYYIAKDTVNRAKLRKLNSSYACAFHPWVQVSTNTGTASGKLWVPPSVAAVGAFAGSTAQSELWFAPAGFTRGGLSPLGGVGGPRVVNVREALSSKDRDLLYKYNINPIASFPGEGIVIFGQKTLQAFPSALDRINVRRLLIYLKNELSNISRRLLFEPNVQTTWNRFKSQADGVLSNVQANLGVTEYKIVLDETTTTADLIDRNILYAKIYIKPTRAIEYIVVDLIVTNTGAEFV